MPRPPLAAEVRRAAARAELRRYLDNQITLKYAELSAAIADVYAQFDALSFSHADAVGLPRFEAERLFDRTRLLQMHIRALQHLYNQLGAV